MFVCVLLIALAVGGFRFFRGWQSKRLAERAETYLSWGDSKSAALTSRRAFQLNSSNAAACRILARIAEHENQPAAIEWRQAAISAAPQSAEDIIALAKTALQFEKISLAENTLAGLDGAGKQTAEYHETAGQLAVAKKDPVAAEKHFVEASKLDPSNKAYQLNVAVFQLQSPSPDVRASALNLLRTFMEDKALRVPAARALRDYAAQRKDGPALLEIAEYLSSYPEATFRDQLSYLQVLRALDHPNFAAKLTDLQNEVMADPQRMTDLISWMSDNQLALFAIHWAKGLPADVVSKRPVPVAVANAYIAVPDWDGLREWCEKKNWGDLEFLRHAFLARAARERGDTTRSQTEWNAATQGARRDGEQLFSLEQNVARWGWKKEAEDLLWMLADDQKRRSSALGALYEYYTENGDTPNLYRAAARLSESRPRDNNLQNNLVQLSLLLKVDLDHAHKSAEQLYQANPQNAVYASTYAFSLYRQGKYPQAENVMRQLGDENLEKPAYAVYYGLVLSATGNKELARKYLDLGKTGRLLPEERDLISRAYPQ